MHFCHKVLLSSALRYGRSTNTMLLHWDWVCQSVRKHALYWLQETRQPFSFANIKRHHWMLVMSSRMTTHHYWMMRINICVSQKIDFSYLIFMMLVSLVNSCMNLVKCIHQWSWEGDHINIDRIWCSMALKILIQTLNIMEDIELNL